MSVERGWGRDVRNTVQRRGEKQVTMARREDVLSARTQEPKREYSQGSTKTAAPKIEKWMVGRQPGYPSALKSRIEQKMREMEGNPELAKFLAKKAKSRVVWSLVGFYFLIGFAPVLLPLFFIAVFFLVGGLILFPPLRTKIFDWVFDTLATFIAANKAKK